MNNDSTIKEYIGHKFKKKAKNFGIDFGDDYNKKGIAKPKFVLPLITLGIGAVFGLNALKKKLNSMQNRMQNNMQMNNTNSYFYQDSTSKTKVEINELEPILNLISAITSSIEEENYVEFIKNSTSIINFFDSIDLSIRDQLFEKINLLGLTQSLNNILESINSKKYDTHSIDTFEEYLQLMELLTQPSAEANIYLIKINKSLLQKICREEISQQDFNSFPKEKNNFALLKAGRNTNKCSIIFIK